MKIAYIVPSLANKGPIVVVRDLVRLMTQNGHECVVLYFDDIKEISMECQCERIPFKKRDFIEYDIVHSHGLRPDLFIFLFKPMRSKTKFITTVHNYVYRDFYFQYNKIISLIVGSFWMLTLKRHDKIITLSKDAMRYYLKIHSSRVLSYAYNTCIINNVSLTPEEKTVVSEFKKGKKLIGINALLTDRKGVDQIIKALPKLPQYKLFIVGDGKSRSQLENLVENLNLSNRVLFAGYIRDAKRFIPYYDIYAMPSRSEGMPISLLEAVVLKKPVLLSNISVFKELFEEDEVSFFELDNIDSLINAVKQIDSNMEEYAGRAYSKFEKKYSPGQMYKTYLQLYEETI